MQLEVNFFSAQPNGPAPREHCNCVSGIQQLAVAAVAAAALQAIDWHTIPPDNAYKLWSEQQNFATATVRCVLQLRHTASTTMKLANTLLPKGTSTLLDWVSNSPCSL
jgi:hypothetical protein